MSQVEEIAEIFRKDTLEEVFCAEFDTNETVQLELRGCLGDEIDE